MGVKSESFNRFGCGRSSYVGMAVRSVLELVVTRNIEGGISNSNIEGHTKRCQLLFIQLFFTICFL